MIFNSFDFNLHKKINLHFIFYVIYYCSSYLTSIPYYIPLFLRLSFSHFFVNIEIGLNFGDFHLLDVIANILLKSSTFIRSFNMHLYRSNINLKIDIPYSLPLPHISLQVTNFIIE